MHGLEWWLCILTVLALVGCSVDATATRSSAVSLCTETAGCSCEEMQSWVGNDWRLTFAQGEVIEHQGDRYLANQDIAYPNAECAPDDPVSWCANWFTLLGSCESTPPPSETCNDGVQNQDETGVDCGGVCPACPVQETCNDGVQNQDETGVDCGGVCAACASGLPTASFAAPQDGESFADSVDYVKVDASDADGIDNVRLFVNGSFVRQENVDPYEWDSGKDSELANLPTGQSELRAVVTDAVGDTSEIVIFVDITGGPTESCSDGLQNQNETGIDCGGVCPACPVQETCSDGLQNQNETGIDCGGVCAPCNSTAPSASFATPLDGETLVGDIDYVKVDASDPDGIDYVRLFINGQFIRQENVTPYEWDSGKDDELANLAPGTYELMALVVDESAEESVVTISVSVSDGSVPSCDDGVQNQNETGIDCGGSCPACPDVGDCQVKGTLRKWHRVAVECAGPMMSEASDATFLDRRMNVTFSNGSTTLVVPGHFAADGTARSSGATAGNVWRAYLMPNQTGTWTYSVSFRQGSSVAALAQEANPTSAPLLGRRSAG